MGRPRHKGPGSPRITQLLSMMPLKRGVIAASLVVAVGAQGPEDGRDDSGWLLLLYLLLVHVLGLFGLVVLVRTMLGRHKRSLRDSETQTAAGGEQPDAVHVCSAAASNGTNPEGAEELAGTLLGIGSSSTRESRGDASSSATVHRRSTGHCNTSEARDELVAVIGNGECYHRTTCGMLGGENRHRVRYLMRSIALGYGYRPCKQCRPR